MRHFIGSVALIIGTSIGAGMLAIPVSTYAMGFLPAVSLFALVWFLMLCAGVVWTDLVCYFQGGANLLTMARLSLGVVGGFSAAAFYLLLLYSLTAAYMAGSGPLLVLIARLLFGIELPLFIASSILPLLFIISLLLSTRGVDLANRILVVGLFATYAILCCFLPMHMEMKNLLMHNWSAVGGGLVILLTSFGYHVILPSLGSYVHYHHRKLYKAVFWGSFITLLIYLIWQFLVIGAIPVEGEYGLADIYQKALPVTFAFLKFNHPSMDLFAALFSFFAIATSFLGVGLSLVDFLKDGMQRQQRGGMAIALFLALLPPALFWLGYPRAFIVALEYAGWFVLFLLMIVPTWIAIKLSKKERFFKKRRAFYLSFLVISFLLAGWMAA